MFQGTRTVFQCTWRNCEKIMSTRTMIEKHIRREHLGWVFIQIVTILSISYSSLRIPHSFRTKFYPILVSPKKKNHLAYISTNKMIA